MRRRPCPALMRHALVAALLVGSLPVVAAAGEREFEVVLHELAPGQYHLVPETIFVQQGETVRMTVVNPAENAESHNLVVCGDAECDKKWSFSPNVAPGNRTTLTFTPDAVTGSEGFEYYCSIFGHKDSGLGMKGRIIVQSADAAPKDTPAPPLFTLLALAALVAVLRRR